MHIELPPVIRALEIFSVKFAGIERHPSMRTGIAHRERMSGTIAANDERNLQQGGFVELISMHLIGWQRAIPEASQHECVSGLALWEIEFGHDAVVGC